MKIGIPAETKADEYRVAITPIGVRELTDRGHEVLIQRGAGEASAIPDADYESQGARIVSAAEAVFGGAELVLKVKEPQEAELALLRKGQILFTYLHLAPAPGLTSSLLGSGATCIAYETVEDPAGGLPLLAPMSEIAGRIAAQAGAAVLQRPAGGRGILVGGVPGVAPASVMVIGGGAVGMNAALVAIGMGAEVFIYDISIDRLRALEVALERKAITMFASSLAIEERLPDMDLVIGGVLVRGAQAPQVIKRDQLVAMKDHAVLVDVAIDQGGCFETSRPTTHSDPTYDVDGVVHYCVANMPGAVPITATYALTSATLPYVLAIADHGLAAASSRDPGLKLGINIAAGRITHSAVAAAVGVEWVAPDVALGFAAAEAPVGAVS